jgi:hypothetical protein
MSKKRSTPARPAKPRKPSPRAKSPAASATEAVAIPDGRWTFTVHKEGKPHECTLDIIEAKLEVEALERQHGITPQNGEILPTPEFMKELVALLQRMGVPATATIAYQVYAKLGPKFAAIMADIAKA